MERLKALKDVEKYCVLLLGHAAAAARTDIKCRDRTMQRFGAKSRRARIKAIFRSVSVRAQHRCMIADHTQAQRRFEVLYSLPVVHVRSASKKTHNDVAEGTEEIS